ncbi:hypothetical protein N665_0007s0039 [Sinapis alba]|nr:hypothetical protein N665_0007s0039 [Sinapis alba]
MPEEIQVLVIERVAVNSIKDLFCLKESSKSMKVLGDRRRVYHFYDVLSVPWGNPSTLYLKGVQFLHTMNNEEDGLAFMKKAVDAGYERAVYTHAMTRKIFWDDGKYFAGLSKESVERIGKLVRSAKWGRGLWHGGLFFRDFEPMRVIRETRKW